MRKFFQSSWFGIPFHTFTVQNSQHIADETFYTQFYDRFFQKYSSYTEIDSQWRNTKDIVTQLILSNIQDKVSVLSIGCGLGYVEYSLSRSWDGRLTIIDPAKSNVTRWLDSNTKIEKIIGYFPNDMSDQCSFDFAYANAIDYIFNMEDLHLFLQSVQQYPIADFLLISASFQSSSVKDFIKYSIKQLAFYTRLLPKEQFWGYLRTRKEYQNAILNAGFTTFDDGFLSDGTYWIKGICK
jgi:SAM-dependent methyltransferase